MKPLFKQKPALQAVTEKYAVAVTREVMETIDPDDPHDPVAKQYLPSVEELKTTPDELADPIGDEAHSPVKGIVHRYADRVLLKPVHVCAVYCRFCFRREMVGPGSEMLSPQELEAALDYIRGAKQIWEVILTGGDPLVLSPRRLRAIMEELEKIDHVKIIRFHTRVPVAKPSAVTDELVDALESKKAVYVMLHCNHPNELTDEVKAATEKFIRRGIPLLSQSALLNSVNNDPIILETLFRRLTELKIKPYHLHHPDLAPGTSHFRLTLEEGRKIMRALRARLSGIAMPAYMLDLPGGHGKIPAEAAWIEKEGEGEGYAATDRQGIVHLYADK